jgi:mycofactocin precursor
MDDTTTTLDDAAAITVTAVQDELVTQDVLVEEVSIDGMCGVY